MTRILRRAVQGVLRRMLANRPRRGEQREVLFLCQNGLMADYLGPVLEVLRDEPRLKFYVTHPRDPHMRHEISKIRAQIPVTPVRLGWAECRRWDLIITADHGYADLASRRRCPVIYTGHGMTGKVVEGEEEDYSYGPRTKLADGTPRYTAMLEASEANRVRIAAHDPLLASCMRVVGSLQDDLLLARLGERDHIREQLGYTTEDRVVLVQSSWGPHSLIQTVGEEILEAAQAGARDHFILSVHPHEYRPTEDGSPSWGERLRALQHPRMRVREPSEPWIEELLAADLVVTDHTSLVIYAALAGKPMLWVPVPARLVREGTALARLRELAPTLRDARKLGEAIDETLRTYPHGAVRALAREINSCPGEARERIRRLVAELLDLGPCENREVEGAPASCDRLKECARVLR